LAKCALALAMLLGFASDAIAQARPTPMLHRDGRRIVDAGGRPVFLKGVNLGGWLEWELWIFGGAIGPGETTTLDRLTSLVGAKGANRFHADLQDAFVTEADIAAIARMGFNAVRVPVNHLVLEDDATPFVYKRAGWRMLDRLRAWCEQHHLYLILELHSAPGGQCPADLMDADPKGQQLWDSEVKQKRTVALWTAIARHFSQSSTIGGYDLLNEPLPPSPKELVSMYRRIIAGIRSADSQHLIVIEGANFARDFTELQKPLTANQALSFHMYTWFGDDRKPELARYRQVAETSGLPLWNGECGENNAAMIQSTVKMLEGRQLALSGWTFWTWKKVKNSFMPLCEIHPPDRWQAVLKWLNWPHWPTPKPTRQQALAAMKEFVAAVRFERNTIHQEVQKALLDHPPQAPAPRKAGQD
jgi:endoglucanase